MKKNKHVIHVNDMTNHSDQIRDMNQVILNLQSENIELQNVNAMILQRIEKLEKSTSN